jgi:single-stranded-DNA-specific exonuclease
MKAMDTACREMVDGMTLAKKYHAESEVTFKELLPENLKYYELLEPLGNGNPAPLFVTRNVKVKHVKKIGQEQGHLKLLLADGSLNFSAVAWRFADSFDALKEANTIDILYAFEKNTYNGDTTLQLRIVDFLTYRN